MSTSKILARKSRGGCTAILQNQSRIGGFQLTGTLVKDKVYVNNPYTYVVHDSLEAIKFNIFFNSLHLFIFFLPLFTFKNERSAVGFST
jgi:hypothetical protein